MAWIFIFALIVANMWLTWRVDRLKNSVVELTDVVRYYAMTCGAGKSNKGKMPKWAWQIKGADDVERMYKALGVVRRDEKEGK